MILNYIKHSQSVFMVFSSNEKLYGMLIKVFEKVYQLEIEE